MGIVISWYLVITAIGWLAWPLAFRLLPGLPDRGYTFSRALGLLLTGYVFWLLTSLGLLQNTTGGILFALLIVLGISLWAYRALPDRDDTLGEWLAERRSLVIIAELLFLVAFFGWTIVRAYNPDISGTEKPMELAFLNGIRNSTAFPPRDPWLSGYAISYYYFGYVIVAMLAKLINTASSVAFNMAVAALFALTLQGSYGLIYNLVVAHRLSQPDGKEEANARKTREGAAASALLGPLMIGLMGNLEGFLELVRSLNLPVIGDRFWTWLDIKDLSEPLSTALWPPGEWRFWWWWRASRVIHEQDAAGLSIGLQPIDEFPFFSFLLGDMHPHVLALPFVLLALALAFNLLNQPDRPNRAQAGLYIIVFGGLTFLNTWDLPFYLFILVAALIVRNIRQQGSLLRADILTPILTGIGLLLAGIVVYLPWYISFKSQAGGILPNAIFATRLHQYLVMFGPFLFVILWFLIYQAARHLRRLDWLTSAAVVVPLVGLLVGAMVLLSRIAINADPSVSAFAVASAGIPVEGLSQEAIMAKIPEAISVIVRHRLAHPLTPLLMIGVLTVALARLFALSPAIEPDDTDTGTAQQPYSTATGFALVLIVTGTLLTLGPEFVYLRDNFGQRINTIFKFYYTTWIMFGTAAAFAIHVLVRQQRRLPSILFAVMSTGLIAAGLVYPALATPNKANNFAQIEDRLPTLDGIDYIRRDYPADYKGILWLQQNAEPDAVIIEAVGGAYSYYGRVSSATGLQTVMGWANHERQWRGDSYSEAAGTREQDVNEIYTTPSIQRALELLNRYEVTYVFVGMLERSPAFASAAGIQKFERYLTPVYRDEGVSIYRVDRPLVEEQP